MKKILEFIYKTLIILMFIIIILAIWVDYLDRFLLLKCFFTCGISILGIFVLLTFIDK